MNLALTGLHRMTLAIATDSSSDRILTGYASCSSRIPEKAIEMDKMALGRQALERLSIKREITTDKTTDGHSGEEGTG